MQGPLTSLPLRALKKIRKKLKRDKNIKKFILVQLDTLIKEKQTQILSLKNGA